MPVLRRRLERVQQARFDPLRRILREAELLRVRIRRTKADAADLVREPVRVRAYDVDGVLAVALDDSRCQRRRHTDAEQEHHHLLHRALIDERGGELRGPRGADADHLGQPLRLLVDHFQGVHAELLDQPLRHLRADALDARRAEELLDADQRLGRARCRRGDTELPAELLVLDPLPDQPERQTLVEIHELADDRHDLLLRRHEARDREARLVVLEHDPLERAVERDVLAVRHW